MKIKGKNYRTIWYENNVVKIIDQTKLPHKFIIKDLKTVKDAINAIKIMEVRGAPLIGGTAAYGLALAIKENSNSEFIKKNAEELIQKITTNDISKIPNGKAQYTCMPNGKGGIIDDLIIYKINPEEFFVVVNASNIEKDWNWIKSANTFDVEMIDLSEEYSLLAVQ